MTIVAKKTVLALYSGAQDPYSHQVRIVLAEKGINVEIHYVTDNERVEDLAAINPYYTVPTLVDRDLVLYEANIIMEYLDERFPHPPLLPVYPVARAESRKMMFRIEKDWYSLMHTIMQGEPAAAEQARKQLQEGLLSLDPIFRDKPYFLSDEFTLIDCCIVPLLWRLPLLGIELDDSAKGIKEYSKRLFDRPSFQASLTDVERELLDSAA